MHEQLLLCPSKRGLIYSQKVVPQPDSSAWFFSIGGLMITAMGTDSLTGLLKLHIQTHTLSLLSHETAAFFPERIVISCVKEKSIWKMELVPHESSVRSSGWCLFRVSVFGNKQLMMVLHSSGLNQWVKTLCSITLFLGVSSILFSQPLQILHCLK